MWWNVMVWSETIWYVACVLRLCIGYIVYIIKHAGEHELEFCTRSCQDCLGSPLGGCALRSALKGWTRLAMFAATASSVERRQRHRQDQHIPIVSKSVSLYYNKSLYCYNCCYYNNKVIITKNNNTTASVPLTSHSRHNRQHKHTTTTTTTTRTRPPTSITSTSTSTSNANFNDHDNNTKISRHASPNVTSPCRSCPRILSSSK